MVKITWTEQSLNDVENIAQFIAMDSEKFAKIQVSRFFNSSLILETFPFSGRIVPELNRTDIRELIQGNYRIIYKIVSDNQIDILTVHHSRRQLKI
jgi:addiction module RelE/StbE family toxin